MSDLALLHIAVAAFVGGHLILSHPLRRPIAGAIGEGGFALVYSLVAFATLGWAVSLWRRIEPDRLWHEVPAPLHWLLVFVMLLAAILFVGSVTAPNPALMGGKGSGAPQGVQRITRHPMMWAFALWAIVHITLSADSRTLPLAGGILVLALLGSALQDGKKRAQNPAYADHMAKTGFVPFAAQLSGRQPWAGPGWIAGIGGLVLWAGLLHAHVFVIGASPLPTY